MQIGKVIRRYRKEKNMTQEEMARALGVTTPAVNKWENGNSLPDITLLAPIARLLGIHLDTLLSYQEDLTNEEIGAYVKTLDERLKKESYDEVFGWAKKLIETYPNCYMLIWQFAVVLNAQLLLQGIVDSEKYENSILDWHKRVLNSGDEKQRTYAADSLYSYYLRKEDYVEAEKYLIYFSEQNPEYKRKKAMIYSKTGRMKEAYKSYEELLFSTHMSLNLTLHDLYLLALKDEDRKKAHYLAEKECLLARLFDMGVYQETAPKLELATIEKDTDKVVEIMQIMLDNVGDMTKFTDSPLFEHMTFKKTDSTFTEEMRKNLIECFRDEETYEFLQKDEKYRQILKKERKS